MSRPVQHTSAITINPTSFDSVNSSYASNYNDGSTAIDGIYSGNVISNGFAGSGSTTRAAFFTNTGQSAASYFYYNFDCSSIPQTATINSVACAVKCGTQGPNYYNTRQVQLCAGTTPKGNATTISGNNTSPSTHTLTVGTWTREELNKAHKNFEYAEGDLIDFYTYQIMALQSKLDYLTKVAKIQNIDFNFSYKDLINLTIKDCG